MVERNGTQLLNLINDLLDLAKIEANRTDIFLSEFQLQKVVNRILETVRPIIEKNQLIECIKNIFNKTSDYQKSKYIETDKDVSGLKKQNKPILIVEDNPDNLLTISLFLKESGYEFVATADGNEAIKIAREILPKMIFMDIHLPGISGLDATKQIKYDTAIKNIPIVAMTAKAMKGDRENILAAGCDDYISKPIDPVELKNLIDKWQ